jgi:hypothetical protein
MRSVVVVDHSNGSCCIPVTVAADGCFSDEMHDRPFLFYPPVIHRNRRPPEEGRPLESPSTHSSPRTRFCTRQGTASLTDFAAPVTPNGASKTPESELNHIGRLGHKIMAEESWRLQKK